MHPDARHSGRQPAPPEVSSPTRAKPWRTCETFAPVRRLPAGNGRRWLRLGRRQQVVRITRRGTEPAGDHVRGSRLDQLQCVAGHARDTRANHFDHFRFVRGNDSDLPGRPEEINVSHIPGNSRRRYPLGNILQEPHGDFGITFGSRRGSCSGPGRVLEEEPLPVQWSS